MTYKAIFIDLDGTLLNRYKRISATAVKAIKEAQKKGALVVINSGRTPAQIERILRKESLSLPYIALNGAYLRDTIRNKTIYKDEFDHKICEKVLEICKRNHSNSIWYSRDKAFANGMFLELKAGKSNLIQIIFEAGMLLSRHFVRMETVEDKIRCGELKVYKCAVMCVNRNKLNQIRNEIEALGILETAATSPVFHEFNAKGVSKGKGMELMSEYYEIPINETIAIGDNENDISMLKAAGLGIAMGNAAKKIRQAAKEVAATNNQDGVAKIIEKYLI